MNDKELLNDKKTFNNSIDIYKDLAAGDPEALKRFDDLHLDTEAIKLALQYLMNNPNLSEDDKNDLIQNSWRINFRAKMPTPEEFLTEKYLGAVATHTYDRVKKNFFEFTNPTTNYRNLILYPHIGYGKAIPSHEQVITPRGPIEMKDLKIGDLICNSYGGYSTVLNKMNFPNEKVYELTFNDGRKVLACGNHNWKAFHSTNNLIWNKEKKTYDRIKYSQLCWKIITTEEIIKDLERKPNHRWKFPLPEPVKHENRNHIIPPYTLGAYLGDGYCSSNSAVLGNDDLPILKRIQKEAINYQFIIEEKTKKESSTLYNGKFLRKENNNKFIEELDRLGLKGKKCNEKFIPREYLYDSIENRIALLQGLMDTDGTLKNNGFKSSHHPTPSFWAASKQLAEDIVELIRGLGGLARIHKYKKGVSGTKNFDAYLIYFNFPKNRFNIFSLERKQKPLNEEYERKRGYRKKRKPQYLILKSIEETDLRGGMCIEVDSDDHCFLTRDYIVTHNSYLSAMITLYFSLYTSLMRNPWKYYGLSQPLYSKVYTDKNSWKYMKDIKIGDEILGSDGKKQKVIETKLWEDDDVYEIELEDGSKAQAGINHLWVVDINGEEKEVNTKYILENIDKEYIKIRKIIN